MVITCCVNYCSNKTVNADDPSAVIQFHRFPLKHEQTTQKWLNAIQNESLKPSTFSFVCSDHFLDTDYKWWGGMRQRLKPEAVPSVFHFPWEEVEPPEVILERMRKMGEPFVLLDRLRDEDIPQYQDKDETQDNSPLWSPEGEHESDDDVTFLPPSPKRRKTTPVKKRPAKSAIRKNHKSDGESPVFLLPKNNKDNDPLTLRDDQLKQLKILSSDHDYMVVPVVNFNNKPVIVKQITPIAPQPAPKTSKGDLNKPEQGADIIENMSAKRKRGVETVPNPKNNRLIPSRCDKGINTEGSESTLYNTLEKLESMLTQSKVRNLMLKNKYELLSKKLTRREKKMEEWRVLVKAINERYSIVHLPDQAKETPIATNDAGDTTQPLADKEESLTVVVGETEGPTADAGESALTYVVGEKDGPAAITQQILEVPMLVNGGFMELIDGATFEYLEEEAKSNLLGTFTSINSNSPAAKFNQYCQTDECKCHCCKENFKLCLCGEESDHARRSNMKLLPGNVLNGATEKKESRKILYTPTCYRDPSKLSPLNTINCSKPTAVPVVQNRSKIPPIKLDKMNVVIISSLSAPPIQPVVPPPRRVVTHEMGIQTDEQKEDLKEVLSKRKKLLQHLNVSNNVMSRRVQNLRHRLRTKNKTLKEWRFILQATQAFFGLETMPMDDDCNTSAEDTDDEEAT